VARGKRRDSAESLVRTTVELPTAIWIKAKQRAAEERTDLRGLILEGLAHVLARKPKNPEKG
jgi:hypothetical protein